MKRWISTRQPSSASWSQTRCCTLTALSTSVCILPYCGSRGAVVSEWRGNMHKSEALECPWWIMDGMQRFCQQNNSSGVSKWGLKLLLLKTKHCSSVYNQIEGVVGCASVPQDTDVCSIHCSGKKKTIAKEISSKHMCTGGCIHLHVGPLFPIQYLHWFIREYWLRLNIWWHRSTNKVFKLNQFIIIADYKAIEIQLLCQGLCSLKMCWII